MSAEDLELVTTWLVLWSTFVGGMGGALVTGIIAFFIYRENTARELLKEILDIQASDEAYILVSDDPSILLSKTPPPRVRSPDDKPAFPYLRAVELRAVLDDSPWYAPSDISYAVIGGKRVWIVRDGVSTEERQNATGELGYPALVTSRGLEDLGGWIERAASAYQGWMLSEKGLAMLRPALQALCSDGIIEVMRLKERLSPEAEAFLKRMKRHPRIQPRYRRSL